MAVDRNLSRCHPGPLAGNEWLLVCLQRGIISRAGEVAAGPSRSELESAWRERVGRARSRYEEKLAISRRMVGERLEWPISLAPDPDGRFALNQALKEESAARTEYMRLLRIFTELILRGTPPKEDPGS